MKNFKSLFQCMIFDSALLTFLIATVGLYFVVPEDFDAVRNMGSVCFGLAVAYLASMAIVFVLLKLRVKTVGHVLFSPPQQIEAGEIRKPWFMSFWGLQLIICFSVACVVSVLITKVSLAELFDVEGFRGAQRMFGAMIDPNWSVLPKALSLIVETVFMAFLATVLAVPVAFVLSFLCAKNVMNSNPATFFVYSALRTLLNIARSIEPLVWAIIFTIWAGIGPFAGMLALFVHSVASLAKNYSELVECIDEGPIEAIQATGATPLQVVWFAMVPQIVLPYTAFTIYRWDINVRMATVIGLVGGGGIGTMFIQYQGQGLWREVGCLVIVVAVVVWLMDTTSAYIREAIK